MTLFTFPHTHITSTQETQSEMTGFWVIASSPTHFPPQPENSKNVHYGRVVWVWVSSFTFPHTYTTSITQKTRSKWPDLGCSTSYPPYSLPHPKMENTPHMGVFSGFGWVPLYSPMPTTYSEHKKPSPNGWLSSVLLHYPICPPPPENGKHTHMERVFWVRQYFTYFTLPRVFRTDPHRLHGFHTDSAHRLHGFRTDSAWIRTDYTDFHTDSTQTTHQSTQIP